ncbi:MAG: FtsX-like permease family protein, partial [Firmicutes bacterium]|nr:FtsX-like permease family protein [Bacillota bacterium]
MVMGILGRKLAHFVRRNLGQFLAATAVVMIGIMAYISMNTTYYNLSQSQTQFYKDNNFADYYFQMVKAPENVVKQIETVVGVKRVTGRIQKDVPIFKPNEERATARLVSFTLPMDNELNRLTLEQGTMFTANQGGSNVEVVVDPQFAPANHISWGDNIPVVVDGKERLVTVVGAATSPEFVYPMKDAANILPDPLKFGIFMVENRQAQQLLNMPGQINQVLLEFMPGADQAQVVDDVKAILKPYGLLGSYARKYQLSHAVLQAKLDGIHSVSLFMPVIFLLMAAMIQFVILRRMVKTQRTQIGVMKALGYSNNQIMQHYTVYALAVSMLGAILGTGLGLLLAGGMSELFAKYFNLPGGLQSFDLKTVVYAFLLSLGIGLVAGITGSRGVVNIQPAESMRPEPPPSINQSFLEKWPLLWGSLAPGWKMTLRAIARNRGRFVATVVGVVFALSLLIMGFFYNDAIDFIMQKLFYQGETYNLTIRFNSLIADNELTNINRLDGVQKAEAFMEMPVRIHFHDQEADEILLAYPADLSMKKLQDETGKLINVPLDGIIINQRTAQKLGLKVGDQVLVETLLPIGPIHLDTVKIVGATQQLFGGGSYINLEQANRILQESHLISGAILKVEPDKVDAVESSLNKMLGIASVLSRQKEIQI